MAEREDEEEQQNVEEDISMGKKGRHISRLKVNCCVV